MFYISIGLIFICLQTTFGGNIEIVSASGCESCPIYLTCRRLTSILAILEATFVPDSNLTEETSTVFPQPNSRQCLNRRCSGINYCSFILHEDCPGAKKWKEGTLFIKYACIEEDRVVKYCNRQITLPDPNHAGVSEGFIRNPGYPRFYGGQSPCRWRIKAPSQQRIQLTILDISVIVDNPTSGSDCTKDHLEVLESDVVIYSTCRQTEPPEQITSVSESLEIVLSSSQRLTPLRGMLLHYTAVGCPVPIPPADSYMVFINDTFAVFSCCVGYVFPDTGTRSKQLHCRGSKWSEKVPLPNCEQLGFPIETEPLPKFSKIMVSDVVPPLIIITALFIINSIILFVIYKAKKKNEINLKDEEIGALNSQEMSEIVT